MFPSADNETDCPCRGDDPPVPTNFDPCCVHNWVGAIDGEADGVEVVGAVEGLEVVGPNEGLNEGLEVMDEVGALLGETLG